MDSGFTLILYVAVKFVAYAAWCFLGVRLLQDRNSLRAGLGYGLIRLFLGVFFGFGIFLIGGMLHLEVPARPILMYLSIYVPVRYLEWTILAVLMRSRAVQASPLNSLKTQFWILGGIVISHLADLPVILTNYGGTKEFLPVGRFLC